MVELTTHQGSVGRVLRAGAALLSEGNLSEDEDEEVREQMNLLNSRWEHLRVASMERQSRCARRYMYIFSQLKINKASSSCLKITKNQVFVQKNVSFATRQNSVYVLPPVLIHAISFYSVNKDRSLSWLQRRAAFLIMVNPTITDTEPNLINCRAIFFDNLVDLSSRAVQTRPGLKVCRLSRRLHEVLMELQHQQLQQLTDWLNVTEARIKRMGAQPLGPDLEDVKHQVEEHKVRNAPCPVLAFLPK